MSARTSVRAGRPRYPLHPALEAWQSATWRGPMAVDVPVRLDPADSLAMAVRSVLMADVAEDDAPGPVRDGGRDVEGLAVPWRQPVRRFGVLLHFTPETLRVPEDVTVVKLLVQHDDDRPIGSAAAMWDTPPGMRGRFTVPPGVPRAVAALAELDARLREGMSVGVELDPDTIERIIDALWDGQETDDEDQPVPIELAGVVRETSLVTVAQFPDARVDHAAGLLTFSPPAERSPMNTVPIAQLQPPASVDAAAHRPGGADVAPTPRATGPGPAPATNPHVGAGPDAMSMAELAAALAPHLNLTGGTVHPAGRFASLGALLLAARSEDANVRTESGERIALALADQITGNNPGVIQPTWLTEVVGIIDRGRPAVTAFGGPLGAGDSGMSINWPYYDGDLEALVGEQVTQKTEVTTGRVDIKSGTANLKTYAGASDISYQLLRRSSPSYREIYARILLIAYAARTDNVFSADLLAAAAVTGGPTWDGVTAESLLAALFESSEMVDDATGAPADIVLAAPDVFALIGGGIGLYPPQYGTQNVPGTAQANTLRVNVSGLEIRKARHFAPGTMLASNAEAARWREDGPFAVEADDVAVLGRDVGIWGMGVTTVTVPAGVVGITTTPAAPLASSKSSK